MNENAEEELADLEALVFGMNPGDWATQLHKKLAVANDDLTAARDHKANQRRDSTSEIEAEALANIRTKAALVLGTLYQSLAAMPLMQVSPRALEGLHYVMSCIADIERGAAEEWLSMKPTRSHPANSTKRLHQLAIVTAIQLLRLNPEFKAEYRARNAIAERAGKKSGTLRDWIDNLYNPATCKNPAARAEILAEVAAMRALLTNMASEKRSAAIDRRVNEILAEC